MEGLMPPEKHSLGQTAGRVQGLMQINSAKFCFASVEGEIQQPPEAPLGKTRKGIQELGGRPQFLPPWKF